MSARYDTIIIGAGMSGLAAALRIAQFERRVVVLERHALWGGLNSFYTLGGRAFDVGLHALTNFVPPRTKGAPLTRVLRQLRIRHEEFRLGEQNFSEILFPGLRLTFSNDFERLENEVIEAFPGERDGFARLVSHVRAAALGEGEDLFISARERLSEYVRDPALREALLLPLLYYGSAREEDLDWYQFVVLFRSIFLEGLSRPEGGVRTILNILVKRLKRAGAELRMRSGVRRVLLEGGEVRGVELENGEILEAPTILSNAGYVETMRLCGEDVAARTVRDEDVGKLSFLESISVLDRSPRELGHGAATSFFCTEERLSYRRPEEPIDVRSGVVSAPDNFQSEEPLPEGCLRLTVLANHEYWTSLPQERYAEEKLDRADRSIASVARYLPDWRPHTVFRDVFTPRTIEHFTGHVGGTVYGSPKKRLDGRTDLSGLYVCGTDQGFLGIIGALHSGVAMANRHVLTPARAT